MHLHVHPIVIRSKVWVIFHVGLTLSFYLTLTHLYLSSLFCHRHTIISLSLSLFPSFPLSLFLSCSLALLLSSSLSLSLSLSISLTLSVSLSLLFKEPTQKVK